MKAFYIIVITFLSAANALPNPGEIQEGTTCKLTSLIPKHSIEIPDLDVDSGATVSLEDPLNIKNTTVNINGKVLKGTYSFTNGVLEGLSTLSHDLDINLIERRFTFNATITRVTLTGYYEIIDGQVKLPTLGEHTFSGQGPLTASASVVSADLGVTFRIDPETQYFSIANLTINFDFEKASIIAENFVVGSQLVNWDEVNQNLRPLYEHIWVEGHENYVRLIEKEINKLLEGCTLMDLIELAKPPQTEQID